MDPGFPRLPPAERSPRNGSGGVSGFGYPLSWRGLADDRRPTVGATQTPATTLPLRQIPRRPTGQGVTDCPVRKRPAPTATWSAICSAWLARMLATVVKIENSALGEDRALVLGDDARTLIVVADGAGGTGAGALAAQAVCDAFLAAPRWAAPWEKRLCDVDQMLWRSNLGGLSTGVVIEVTRRAIHGASVGDSCAWLIDGARAIDLTQRQRRKPLLGSGRAQPTPFGPIPFRGRLLVATDGLMNYARRPEILRRATLGALEASALALLDAVRLPRGVFQDDVTVVLAANVQTA